MGNNGGWERCLEPFPKVVVGDGVRSLGALGSLSSPGHLAVIADLEIFADQSHAHEGHRASIQLRFRRAFWGTWRSSHAVRDRHLQGVIQRRQGREERGSNGWIGHQLSVNLFHAGQNG